MFKSLNIYIIERIVIKFYSQVELTMLTILQITLSIIIYLQINILLVLAWHNNMLDKR